MGVNYVQHFSALQTPQTQAASPLQKPNNAGGFSFVLDPFDRLDRFLILGSDKGTYYVSEKKLTVDNAKNIQACVVADGLRTVARIVEVSDRGLAPKNDPAIFALAVAAGAADPIVRKAALEALPKVCRIGTHLFHFARDVEHFRRWGRGLRNAVASWYNDRPADKLAVDLIKYRQRDGWSHRDMLRLSHARPRPFSGAQHAALYRYVTAGVTVGVAGLDATLGERTVKRSKTEEGTKYGAINGPIPDAPSLNRLPSIIYAFEEAQWIGTQAGEALTSADIGRLVKLITDHGLTHEMLPTTCLKDARIWEALLEKMPITATIRNLGRMSSLGLFQPMSANSAMVKDRLLDVETLKRGRVHPLNVLTALKTYQNGKGDKGSLTWTADRQIVDALDEAFYLSFEAVEPTGKRTMLALDVSSSMTWGACAGCPITPREASAAMAMVTARVEKDWAVVGFTGHLTQLNISPKQRLDDVIKTIERLSAGSTNCSLPMQVARESKTDIDIFHVYTDDEVNAGAHPHQELTRYRQASGRNAKLVVVGATATEFTIADPNDPGMLDVVGFSADVPAVIANFARS